MVESAGNVIQAQATLFSLAIQKGLNTIEENLPFWLTSRTNAYFNNAKGTTC
jgi:hypothetical protein